LVVVWFGLVCGIHDSIMIVTIDGPFAYRM
jgi:hypothetical protein